MQDNLLKSSDGFFTSTQLKADAISEFTVTTGTQGADSSAGGAILVAGRTKSGSNDLHGGGFWQHRNTALNANYYFNNIDGLPRDRILLNQFGGNIGGPIWKNKVFFFHNNEEFRLPQTYNAARTVLTDSARTGIYTYAAPRSATLPADCSALSATQMLCTRNLYALAAARNPTLPAGTRAFPTTVDPVVAGLLVDFAAGTQLGQSLCGSAFADGLHRAVVGGARPRGHVVIDARRVHHFVRRQRRTLVWVEEDGHVADLPAQEAERGRGRVERAAVALDFDLVVVEAVEVAGELELALRVGEDGLDAPVVSRPLQAQLARGPLAARQEELDGGRRLRAGRAPRAQDKDERRCQPAPHAFKTSASS